MRGAGNVIEIVQAHGEPVGIKTLKNKLSEYVRPAACETVLISDRDRVRRSQAAAVRSPTLLLADAVRQGLITLASLAPGDPPPAPPGVCRSSNS